MRSSRDYVKWEMEKQAALKSRYEQELAELPEGKLKLSGSKGNIDTAAISDMIEHYFL